MPLSFTVAYRNVKTLLADESIQIPPHQRPEIWELRRKQRLIETVLDERPMPNITIREALEGGMKVQYLEDGQQRYYSLLRYTQNQYKAQLPDGSEKFYSELSPAEKAGFDYYPVYVMSYSGATAEQTFRMFQDLQDGKPLTPGQRFHAMSAMSPIVNWAKERILEGTERLAVRARAAFGLPEKPVDNKSRDLLKNAMAIAGGCCIGADFITTSYDIIGPHLMKPVPAEADRRLEQLIDIYEFADDAHKWPKKQLKKYQWPVGRLTGFILWSIVCCRDDMDALINGWYEFLVHMREDTNKLAHLTNTGQKNNNLSAERWQRGFRNIFVGAATLNRERLEGVAPSDEDLSSDDDSE